MCVNHLESLQKCRFWFMRSEARLEILHFQQALGWCQTCWSMAHTFCRKRPVYLPPISLNAFPVKDKPDFEICDHPSHRKPSGLWEPSCTYLHKALAYGSVLRRTRACLICQPDRNPVCVQHRCWMKDYWWLTDKLKVISSFLRALHLTHPWVQDLNRTSGFRNIESILPVISPPCKLTF